MFRHPKYYKELRKRNKSDQAISSPDTREVVDSVRSGPGLKLRHGGLTPEASSFKLQASSVKHQAVEVSSSKHQAPSGKVQASSRKHQAP